MEYIINNQYLVLTIPKEFNNYTLKTLLDRYHASTKLVHSLRMSKDVYINEEPVNQNFERALNPGDEVKLPVFTSESIDFVPEAKLPDILYEDDFILVVNKPAGLEVHPDIKTGLNTLANRVAYYYQETNQKHKVRYIHRLDRDTTGVVVFAKNYFTHNLYDYLLSEKKINRYYYALVLGVINPPSGFINKKIGKDRHHNQRRIVSKTGQDALTYYRVLKTYPDYSLVELELATGRTHQIRVHLSSINHPIIGDELYGGRSPLINRQALHAIKVKLLHPVTLEPFYVEAPLPDDFLALFR